MAQRNDNNIEEEDIDNFLHGIADILEGRFYFTLYHQYSQNHSRIFHSKGLKRCLCCSLILSLLLPLGDNRLFSETDTHDQNISGNINVPYPHISFHGEAVYSADESKVEQHVRNNSHFANPRSLDNGKKTLEIEQGQVQEVAMSSKANENPNSSYYWFDILIGLFLKYILVTACCYIVCYLIPGLYAVAHEVIVRHIIAKNRNNLICGLFRIQRVRPRD